MQTQPRVLSMQRLLFTIVFCSVMNLSASAQEPRTFALNCKVSLFTPINAIKLSWSPVDSITGMVIKRKLKSESSWQSVFTLPDTATQFIDSTAVMGVGYEYEVTASKIPPVRGYIYAGYEIPPVHHRGKLILLVDAAYTSIETSVQDLISDLTGDGWQVIRHTVSRNSQVTDVKNLVLSDFNADTINTKALLLLGHIPVPYSGDFAPDYHADHQGAWPADVYYADMTGVYTDFSVNDTNSAVVANDNVPGDGKFDQNFIPGVSTLMCGRVDLTDLSFISTNDTMLIQRYIQKNHDYRFKINIAADRALVDDNFGFLGGEKFATCGWRNFYALMDSSNADSGDYFTDMSLSSYLWSYACGQGTITSCQGIGITQDFSTNSVKNIFTMLLGSYYGDWNTWNNFMRAPLASQGWTLASCWSGRPYWMFHHMGLGEPIGYSTMITQNNYGLYDANIPQNQMHIALMGDPTLREHIVAPPSLIDASEIQNTYSKIQWQPSADAVSGYFIYRAPTPADAFALITPSFVTSTTYVDSFPFPGIQYYMVRAVALQQSNTGTYYNLSQGITDSVLIGLGINDINTKEFSIDISPNPFTSLCNISIEPGRANMHFDAKLLSTSGVAVRNYKSVKDFSIKRSELASGSYSLLVYKDSKLVARRKIIIQ